MTATTAARFDIINSNFCGPSTTGGLLITTRQVANSCLVFASSSSREHETIMSHYAVDKELWHAAPQEAGAAAALTKSISIKNKTTSVVAGGNNALITELFFLPDEVLRIIFQYAQFPKQFALVCKRWNTVYRQSFCYDDERLGWVEGYRWCINFARQQAPRRERERKLQGLVRKVLDGLTKLVKESSRNMRTVVKHSDMAQALFIVAASEGYSYLVNKMLEEDERIDPADDNNAALVESACRGHEEVVNIMLSDPRVDLSALAAKDDPRAELARKRNFVCDLLEEHHIQY
eukprot:TRINITY_DN2047_c0_g1_i1.p1 TRINITY_DN2047_c0_g1~~TRINITY_DN2047_c0_g1_i1.p1  ORF type:complete len:291 (+),score=68.03 TRINITY_DN2047_c0_g1_i1:441-1313(+)